MSARLAPESRFSHPPPHSDDRGGRGEGRLADGPAARHGREGFILVAVLAVLAMLASLIGGLGALTRTTLDGALTSSERLKLDALVRAGIELAAHQLYGLKRPAQQVSGQEIRLDDGTVGLTVEAEAGRIDLNGADPALLAGLYRATGLRRIDPDTFAAGVVRWRERFKPAAPGSDQADPDAAPPPPTREGFQSARELLWLPGMTEQDAAALEPFVTVLAPQGGIDPSAASDTVLWAIPGITPLQVERIRRARAAPGSAALSDLPDSVKRFLAATPAQSFRVRVTARTAMASGTTVEAVLVRAPRKDAPYYTASFRNLY